MDFELSDDQVALREAARTLLEHRAAPERVRTVVDGGTGVDDELWAAMVEQGWSGLSVPADLGGLGLGVVELAVLCEQVGGHAAPAPFTQQMLALDALLRAREAGSADVEGWLEGLVAGDHRATVAWRSVHATVDEAGGWSLTGRTEPAIGAPVADVAVLEGRTGDGSTGLFALALDAGWRPDAEPAMDRTRSLGWLSPDGAAAVRLGGEEAVRRFTDLGATLHAAELLGGAERALSMSVAYAKEREQFGKPIGLFQAVKHRCADMLVDVEGMRSAVYYAAWALDAEDPDATLAASTAKAWCSDASRRVLAGALQVHGGIGFTWEHDLHFFLKRGQLDQVSFGDAAHHRARLAELLRARVSAGAPVL
jgi:alkylation response protein AidB-like acyl-CoA dehydrogenase